MSISKELSRFYRKQGLTGKHLRAALKHDKRAVRQIVAGQGGYRSYSLLRCFVWSATPQGVEYWSARSTNR